QSFESLFTHSISLVSGISSDLCILSIRIFNKIIGKKKPHLMTQEGSFFIDSPLNQFIQQPISQHIICAKTMLLF
ncbi:uncharacterized protein METZ01_LOCUS365591, partial [marine metagenome]